MASGQFAVVYRQIGRLFRSGTAAGLSEVQLLDRFIVGRDESAFEAIVARHGPMVLGVCRGLLRDPNDVDDAFQATFLVLVKKADSLRSRDLLGNWLHGVAHRVARRVRVEASRRRDRDRLRIAPEATIVDHDRIDIRPLIHEEVDRLPAPYRAAVVLCYLEGRTHDEAALELGWPVGTVRGRLSRARDLLRTRLTRRGVALSSGALLASLAHEVQAVPPGLLETTLAAGSSAATRSLTSLAAASIAASPRVISLAQGVLQAMSLTKLKLAATVLVAGLITGPGVVTAFQTAPARGQDGPQLGASIPPASAPSSKLTTPLGVPSAPVKGRLRQDRLKLAEQLFQDRKRLFEAGEISVDDFMPWHRRLYEAKLAAGVDPAAAVKAYVDAAKAAETATKALFDQGERTKSNVMEATYALLEAEMAAEGVAEGVTPQATPPGPGPAPNPIPLGGGGGFDGGFDGSGPARWLPKLNPADLERNKVIEQALEKTVPMTFAKGVPLEAILRTIREATVDAKAGLPHGVPFYIDPASLVDDQDDQKLKTLPSTVAIDLEEIPLRVSLRLLLDQHELVYQVRDRMVYIFSLDHIDMRSEGAQEFQQSRGFRPMGRPPGGMGGMPAGAVPKAGPNRQ